MNFLFQLRPTRGFTYTAVYTIEFVLGIIANIKWLEKEYEHVLS